MCFGSAPKPPDPIATARAQSDINRNDLTFAAGLNQINQVNPFGQVSYSGDIGSPDRTQTTTLNPEIQGILDSQIQLTGGLSDLANERLAGAPRTNFSLNGAPNVRQAQGVNYATGFNAGPGAQSSFDNGGALQRDIAAGNITQGFDAGGQAQRSVDISGAPALNTDFSNLSQQAQDAAYRQNSRYLDPQFAQQEQSARARLAAQGVTEGSQAYQQEMDNLNRTRQQAYEGARDQSINQGFDLESQMFGQNLAARQQGVGEQFQLGTFGNQALAQQFGMNQSQAQFQNQAQQQGFAQNEARAKLNNEAAMMDFGRNMASAQFGNDAAAQNYAQNRGAAQFSNDAMANQFNAGLNLQQADQSWRNQAIGEDVLSRNQNINEAMSFVNGAPIAPQNPTFQPFATSTAAQSAPDAIGLAASNYNTQANARASILSSIFGAVGQAGGAAASCWVAREVYGVTNPKWIKFRSWMLADSPAKFARLYLKYGERFAEWVKDKPIIKFMIRSWMDTRIAHAA